jgi:hypothetical protein
MNSTKPMSSRRLQARAAKSAIRRINDIYNVEIATIELNKFTDPSEREKCAAMLRHRAETEVKKLARLLTDLIPTDLSWDEAESPLKIEQYQMGNYVGSSTPKYKIPSNEVESPALRKLWNNYTSHPKTASESFDVDYLHPMGSPDQLSDDEFMIEWYRRSQESQQIDTSHSDDGENEMETILV